MRRTNNSVRRTKFDIIDDILSAIRTGKNRKTQIMYRAKLSFEQLQGSKKNGSQGYIPFLKEKGLIIMKNDNSGNSTYFEVTDKGKEFMKGYENLKGLIQ